MKLFATATTSHGSLSQLYLRASIATGLSELDSSTRASAAPLSLTSLTKENMLSARPTSDADGAAKFNASIKFIRRQQRAGGQEDTELCPYSLCVRAIQIQ